MSETPEARTLRENLGEIAKAISSQESGPTWFADQLWQEGFAISRDILSATGKGDYWKVSQLLQTVEVRVRDTYGDTATEFLKLVKILGKEAVYKELADYMQKQFSCLQTSGSSTHQAAVSSVAKGKATGVPEPSKQPLAPIPTSNRKQVEDLAEDESWDLSVRFAVMFSKIVPLLAMAVSVEVLKIFLQSLCHVKTRLPFIEPSLYRHCTSTAEVMEGLRLQHYFHPTQLNLLKKMVENYGCTECNRLLQVYESKLPKSVPLKNLSKPLSDKEIQDSRCTAKIKVIVEGDYDTIGLEEVENVKQTLERSTGVSTVAIIFVKHEPGSVVLTFLIPANAMSFFAEIRGDDADLAANGICKVDIYTAVDLEVSVQRGISTTTVSTCESDTGVITQDLDSVTAFATMMQENRAGPKGILDDSHVTSHGAETIAVALYVNTSLQELSLCGNSIGDEGAGYLSEAMKQNNTLVYLLLDENDITSRGAAAIASALCVNTSLKSLSLSCNSIGDEGVHCLSDVMNRSGLEYLNLDKNSISSHGAALLATALYSNTSLKWLSLWCNHIGDDGVRLLACSLEVNTTLEHLDLCRNHFCSKGAAFLMSSLCTNMSLKSLDISGSDIGEGGITHLSRALHTNKSIEDLSVSLETVTDESACKLSEVLEVSSLQCLWLWDPNYLSGAMKNRLRESAHKKGIELNLYSY